MRVHFLATVHPHYIDHLAPIYLSLPDDIRGDFYVRSGLSADRRAQELGITTTRQRRFRPNELIVVAGFDDYRQTQQAKVVFYNHGVGQTYTGTRIAGNSAYSGGRGRQRAVMFLCPSQRDAANNLAAYPNVPAVPIGVPYLDRFTSLGRPTDGPVVISFHGNVIACPETRYAFPWIHQEIARIAATGEFDLLGHAHPRAQRQLKPFFDKHGIRFESDYQKVLDVAGVFVIDNSSSGYEMAAIGVPTVWLNPPFYRRDVEHGLRFWEHIPGIEVDKPEHLEAAIKLAPYYPPERWASAIHAAYAGPDGELLIDGHATTRAVDALCRLTHDLSTSPPISSTV